MFICLDEKRYCYDAAFLNTNQDLFSFGFLGLRAVCLSVGGFFLLNFTTNFL